MIVNINPKNAFYFQWHFLDACNLRCSHCYQNEYKKQPLSNDNLITIANTLNTTLQKWQKIGRISLTGGEPFVTPDILFMLLEHFELSEHFYWIGILTNGTLIDETIANKLKYFKKLAEVQVSIDGASSKTHDLIRGKGAFNKAIKGLKHLKEKNISTSIMFTLHKQNIDESLSMLDLAKKIGVDAITIERITPMSQSDIDNFLLSPTELKNIYQKIYQKKQEIEKESNLKIRVSRPLWTLIDNKLGGFCPAGLTSLSILPDGTVLPCRRLNIPIGNILTDGLYKIWYQSEVLWKLRNKNNLIGKCKNCEYIHACGGCRAIAYTVNNDIMAEDPQCWL